jgi:hypothetical protein
MTLRRGVTTVLLQSCVLALGACSTSPVGPRDAGIGKADARAAGHDAPSGSPVLTELSVVGSAAQSLVPPFSSDVHDYYVRCAAGANSLTVTMTASAGAESVLQRPVTSKTARSQTVTISAMENQAVVAAATDGITTTAYWVRCLPPDFPALQMSRYASVGSPPPGYYLVGNFVPLPGLGSYAMVVDGNGVPVWYVLGAPGGMGDVDHVISGTVSSISYGAPMAPFDVRTVEPPSTTPLTPAGTLLDGHELQVVPGGLYVVISNPLETGDLTGITIPLPDGGAESFGPGSTMQACDVVEFDATGTVAWQWIGSEHLDPVRDTTLPALATAGPFLDGGGPVVDPFHCNSVDVDPVTGNLLVSARNMDSIFYVDRVSGAIIWKMGGATYTKDQAAYVSMTDPFYRQHDARLLPGWSAACGGAGEISVFDDESQRPGPARGVLYDVLVGTPDGGSVGCPDGGAPGTARVAWQYSGAVSSGGVGSFRITADGSRIIGWGFGAENLVFTEVDAEGNALLDFEFTDGSSSYRAIKVPLTAFDLAAMRNTAGSP